MANVQLSGREVTVVYTDMDTGRILGFGVEGALPPMNANGFKWRSEVLLHASDIDRWANKWREQTERDNQESTIRKIEQERGFRKSLRSAIEERGSKLDQRNRDINRAMLDAQDKIYQQILSRKMKAETCLAAEKYEATAKAEDIASESPFARKN